MKSNEVERLFVEDVREKRKAASGSFHKRGKGVKHGFSGALRTPYHFMTTREKNQLNGKVESYFMYETIIPIEEFKLKDKELQKAMLTRWREIYSNEKIFKELGIQQWVYYNLVTELDVPKKGYKQTGKPRKSKNSVPKVSKAPSEKVFETHSEEVPKVISPEIIQAPQKLITKGLYLEYNGDYNSEELNKLFTKLQLLLDGEYNQFKISLSLAEKID